MTSANQRRLYNIAAAVLLAKAAGSWLQNLWAAQHKPLLFDDAYMFARYAHNIRHGLGLSWNLDGAHTYGPTSLLWAFVVLVFSYLPIGAWKMLTLASWLCSIGAVIAIAWAVSSNARSQLFSKTWRVLPLVALPLADTLVFSGNQATGMETMLATLLAALFVGLALLWHRGRTRPQLVALAALLLFLARPESALAILLLPTLLFFLLPNLALARRSLATLLAVFLAGVALDLLACKLYFHTAFPLSFYMKSRHAYEGYHEIWHPELLMLAFFAACQLYLVALIFLARRRDLRLIACCLAPALAVFAYLLTVTQIMGFNARYYTPYLAFFIVPALLVLDSWITNNTKDETRWPSNTLVVRSATAAVLMLGCLAFSSESVQGKVRRLESRTHYEYVPAQLEITATAPLPPQLWDAMMATFTDDLVAPLPPGVTVAATEVGYLGSQATHANIIDLAGLNDTAIALHGFDLNALLARKPDILWMPNTSYTFQRGLIVSNPAFLQQYVLYAGAANYGIALRKDSPFRPQIDRQMQLYWTTVYPQSRMSDYLVKSATWSGDKFKVTDN